MGVYIYLNIWSTNEYYYLFLPLCINCRYSKTALLIFPMNKKKKEQQCLALTPSPRWLIMQVRGCSSLWCLGSRAARQKKWLGCPWICCCWPRALHGEACCEQPPRRRIHCVSGNHKACLGLNTPWF